MSYAEKRKVWEAFYAVYSKESHGIDEVEMYIEKVCNSAVIIGAYDGKKIVGFVAFYANDYESKVAYITQILVIDQYRNRKIGEMLINACQDKCREKGFTILKLEVNKNNENAQGFYEHLNFKKEVEKEKSYYMIKKI